MVDLVWLVPALPLAGFLILLAMGRRLGEPLAGWLATVMVAGSFVVSCLVFLGLLDLPGPERFSSLVLFEWMPVGNFSVDVGFLVDPLSVTMILFITGIAALIHLYAIGYMHGDERFSQFFLYLNLFVFSMLMLVLGDNLLVTFLGWEGVGACSYFLVSFWFTEKANATAGKKAFVTNRVGDWGFLVAIFLTFATVGSIRYVDVLVAASAGQIAAVTATGISLLLLVGAVGKSAQLPLFVWLPDAMAGPTPVSALIHAATMVTAGVYLLVRMNPLLAASYDWVPTLIAWLGAITALFAATVALAQNDIKRVLAYSTISQLGYLFLAVGVGGYVPAIFHMVTHAFFKALLFLGRRLGHPRHAPRAGHAPLRGPGQAATGHVRHVHRRLARHRRGAAVLRLLVEGRDPGLRLGQQHRAVGGGLAHRRVDRLLHEPPGLHDVLRPLPLRRRHARGDRRSLGHPGGPGGGRRRGGDAAPSRRPGPRSAPPARGWAAPRRRWSAPAPRWRRPGRRRPPSARPSWRRRGWP